MHFKFSVVKYHLLVIILMILNGPALHTSVLLATGF